METSHEYPKKGQSEIDKIISATENISFDIKSDKDFSETICAFYSNYGYCKFGRKCRYKHLRKKWSFGKLKPNKDLNQETKFTEHSPKTQFHTSTHKNRAVHEVQPISTSANNFNKKATAPKKTCRYFKAGYCDKGEKCHYDHSVGKYKISSTNSCTASNSVSTNFNESSSIPVCRYFRKGFCQKGDRCKYYHKERHIVHENSTYLPSPQSADSNENFITSSLVNSDNSTNANLFTGKENSQNISLEINNSDENQLPSSFKGSDNSVTVINSTVKNANSDILLLSKNCDSIENVFPPKFSDQIHPIPGVPSITKCETNGIVNINKIFDLSSLSENKILQLRDTEITQLKKRFPNYKIIEENAILSFEFLPTDPDWAHDVTNFHMQVSFPENYPVEVCRINILPSSSSYIPESLLSCLNKNIEDWLMERHELSMKLKKVELLFRPFLRWFDKNLVELFSIGLKKVHMEVFADRDDAELISLENINSLNENLTPCSVKTIENCSFSSQDLNISQFQVLQNTETYQADSSEQNLKMHITASSYLAQKLGVNILFKGLEFIEGIAALTCTKLAIMLHCGRCKTSCNIKTIPKNNNSLTCAKCSKQMQCNFDPSVMHQFSNVLGTVYLVECQGVDVNLVECAFLVDCLNCSKQVPVQGLHYGPKQRLWCTFCNQKILITIESSKFQTSGHTYSNVKTTPIKKVEKQKGPLIKEGGPLPEFGACKHYKKSHRWLRFPCCGRVYPCDICHEEKESDHEMKFASRMICGFCSKEQPYSKDKPCTSCTSNVTSKSGSHWEGGKGCRNKIKMARDDKKKYAGKSKTISKKAQSSGKKKG